MKKALILTFLLLALASPAVMADTLTFTGSYGPLSHGYYVGPYQMLLQPDNVVLPLWCITFHVAINNGPFDVNVDTTDVTAYGHLAWIVGQYDGTNAAIIQWALWLGDPVNGAAALSAISGDTALLNAAQALADSTGFYSSGWRVFEDVNGNHQSFIQLVPEPSILILLGIGLGAASLLTHRKRS